jgi:AcrR family transcriptional regulator
MTTAMSTDTTRNRLLRATATEVARHGIKGASLRGVAGRAGISAASIFHHFPEGKDQLVRAMMAYIMQTIATRMTPTIQAGSTLAPADLIVQCAALLWDFMEEYPDYAGALMRDALEPDEGGVDVLRDNAAGVVELATAYIEAGQASGQLAPVHTRRFLLRLAIFTITFHAAPSMRRSILGKAGSVSEERGAFLASVRAEIAVP